MIKTFTEDDLIRYIYGESSDTEKTEIENAVICDNDLEEKLISLTFETKRLDCLAYQPSVVTLKKIMDYSAAY